MVLGEYSLVRYASAGETCENDEDVFTMERRDSILERR